MSDSLPEFGGVNNYSAFRLFLLVLAAIVLVPIVKFVRWVSD